MRWTLVPSFLSCAFIRTRQLISRLNPDIVHAHFILPLGFVAALAVPKAVPLVMSVHGSDAFGLRGHMFTSLKRLVLSRADVITCNGSKTEAAVSKMLGGGKSIFRIPMGAASAADGRDHEVALPQNRFKVLFAGRLIRGKGLDDLLDAMAGFAPKSRPFLLIAGVGPEEGRFLERAKRLGIWSDVRFLGGIEHGRLLALMREVDTIVVPTRNTELIEAQGLVIAEAMFAAAPVIATTGGGAEDHVVDGRTGLLVPPGDPASLREALQRLVNDPQETKRIGSEGERYARENLSWTAVAHAFDSAYLTLLADTEHHPRAM
jgi:glycosyltransferase involved in cell wall biosynthesis